MSRFDGASSSGSGKVEFVWLASTLGRFNANELRRADHEVHDIADGRYDGRIQKYQQGVSSKAAAI